MVVVYVSRHQPGHLRDSLCTDQHVETKHGAARPWHHGDPAPVGAEFGDGQGMLTGRAPVNGGEVLGGVAGQVCRTQSVWCSRILFPADCRSIGRPQPPAAS